MGINSNFDAKLAMKEKELSDRKFLHNLDYKQSEEIESLNHTLSITELWLKISFTFIKIGLLFLFAFFVFAYLICAGWMPQHIINLLIEIKSIIATELTEAPWQNLLIISLLIVVLRGYSVFIKAKSLNFNAKLEQD